MGSEQVVSPHGSGSPLLPPSLALNCQQGGSDVGLQVPRWSAEPIFGAVFRCSDRSQPPTTLILVQQHVQSPSGSKCPGNEGLENILVCYYDNLLLCPMLVPDLFFFSCWNGLSFLAAWRKSQQVRFASKAPCLSWKNLFDENFCQLQVQASAVVQRRAKIS